MKGLHHALLALTTAARLVRGLGAADWRKQSIYQVMTDRFARTDGSTTAACDTSAQVYCGGSYQGLIAKLDYIQGMGFTAIWISPVVKQMDGSTTDGSSYHGYWAQDIYSLNSAFGTAADLKALSAALHARGMYLMLDVVTNHMAYDGCSTCVDYSVFDPFSSSSYFHTPCSIDYSNQTSVEQCWETTTVVSLADLRTEDSSVRSVWNAWIADMIATYSIDGLRIDSAKHQETSFYPQFSAAANDTFLLGEVLSGDPAYLAPYQNYMDGLLDYASYYWITAAFESTSGSISTLATGINTLKSAAVDTSLYGSFLENHDQARFGSLTSDLALARNAIAFTMLKDGIPVVYQGQEQHLTGSGTPNNREALWLTGFSTSATLYPFITTLNQLRARAIAQDSTYLSYQAYPTYTDSNTVVMRKGFAGAQVIGVYTNLGASSSSKSLTLTTAMTGFTAGQAVIDVLSCTSLTTDSSASLAVTLTAGLPRAFYPAAGLAGSGICPALTGATTTTTTSTTTTTKSSSTSSKSTTTTSKSTTTTSTKSSSTSTSTKSSSTSTSSKSTSTTVSTTLTTSTRTSTTTTSSTASCTATSIPITFSVLETTSYGDTVKVSGNVTALGAWDTDDAVALSASAYTTANPVWSGTVALPAGAAVAFKFVKVSSAGTVTWEGGSDRVYAVGCAAGSFSGSWS